MNTQPLRRRQKATDKEMYYRLLFALVLSRIEPHNETVRRNMSKAWDMYAGTTTLGTVFTEPPDWLKGNDALWDLVKHKPVAEVLNKPGYLIRPSLSEVTE